MSAEPSASIPAPSPERGSHRFVRLPWTRHFSLKVEATRFMANAGALALTATILPGLDIVSFEGAKGYSLLILAAVFGLINALIKPILQAFALPFLFDTMGGAVIIVNAILLGLLDAFASDLIQIDRFLTYIFGGLLLAAFSYVLENVLGVTPPIVRDAEVDPGRPAE